MQMHLSSVDVSFASGIACFLQYPPLKRKHHPPGCIYKDAWLGFILYYENGIITLLLAKSVDKVTQSLVLSGVKIGLFLLPLV